MDKIIKYDRIFTVAHTNIIILLLIYYFALFFGGRPEDVTLAKILPIFIAFTFNILFSHFNYFKRPIFFYLTRGIYLTLTATLSLFTLHTNPYGAIISISCYYFMVLEIIITSKHYSRAAQIYTTLLCTMPVLVANIIIYFISDNLTRYTTDIVVFFVFTICLLYYIIRSISTLVLDLEDQIRIQCKLYNDTKQANETLLVTQQKLKQANEQLGKQKLDLVVLVYNYGHGKLNIL